LDRKKVIIVKMYIMILDHAHASKERFGKNSIGPAFSLFFIIMLLGIPQGSVRATELQLGIDGVETAVLLRSAVPINAVEGVLNVEQEPVDISVEGSLVQFWVERPKWKDKEVRFSGIIPGGYAGTGVLFRIRSSDANNNISIDSELSRTLLNDGLGTEGTLFVPEPIPLPEDLRSAGGKSDVTPPPEFLPEITTIPTEEGEKRAIVFSVEDAGVGIDRYEIAFSKERIDPLTAALSWRSLENPYILNEAESRGFVYIRAIDKAGNSRYEVIPPELTIFSNSQSVFGILGVLAVVGAVVLYRRRSRLGEHHADT
jgi:hypothetical protein